MILVIVLILTLIWIAGWVILERRKKRIFDNIFKSIESSKNNNENLYEQIEELFKKVNDMKNKRSEEKKLAKTQNVEISKLLKEMAYTEKPAFVVEYDEEEGFEIFPSDPFEFWYGDRNKQRTISKTQKNKTDYPYPKKDKLDNTEYTYN